MDDTTVTDLKESTSEQSVNRIETHKPGTTRLEEPHSRFIVLWFERNLQRSHIDGFDWGRFWPKPWVVWKITAPVYVILTPCCIWVTCIMWSVGLLFSHTFWTLDLSWCCFSLLHTQSFPQADFDYWQDASAQSQENQDFYSPFLCDYIYNFPVQLYLPGSFTLLL